MQGTRGMPQALDADEGRSKLRKAAGRSKHPLIRGSPNGETCPGEARAPLYEAGTR